MGIVSKHCQSLHTHLQERVRRKEHIALIPLEIIREQERDRHTERITKYSNITFEGRDLSKSLHRLYQDILATALYTLGRGSYITYRASFDECGSYAHERYEENTGGVVVILINRPKYETSYLKNIKWVESLASQDIEHHE
jgi:hypothetical protein